MPVIRTLLGIKEYVLITDIRCSYNRHRLYTQYIYIIYSRTSLIRTPTDGQNLFALSGIRINRVCIVLSKVMHANFDVNSCSIILQHNDQISHLHIYS